jgi:glutamate decarboxylase
MVHLAKVRKNSEVVQQPLPGVENLCLDAPGDDEFSTSVYGSRFAAQDLPSHEMPEREMPKDVAYRMIKDDLSLDGNPMLKYILCCIEQGFN